MGREEKVGSRISERGEEDANRELQDLEEGQQQAMAVEGRLGGLLAEQGRVQEEKSQGALDRHWRRLKEKQKERQGKLENAALESEDFATRVNDQVDRHHRHRHHYHRHHCHRHHNKNELPCTQAKICRFVVTLVVFESPL